MSKFVVVIFPNEAKAYEGTRALKELHAEASLAVYGMAVVADFLDKVSKELSPGKAAIVAEVAEDWVTPLDTRMGATGGTVVRELRMDFEDEMVEKDVKARRAEIAQLKEEVSHASAEDKAKLTARINEAHAKLKNASDRVEAQISRQQQATDAKIKVLQEQAAKAKANAKAKIDQRISELRADHEQRSTKLKQAWKLTKEALAA